MWQNCYKHKSLHILGKKVKICIDNNIWTKSVTYLQVSMKTIQFYTRFVFFYEFQISKQFKLITFNDVLNSKWLRSTGYAICDIYYVLSCSVCSVTALWHWFQWNKIFDTCFTGVIEVCYRNVTRVYKGLNNNYSRTYNLIWLTLTNINNMKWQADITCKSFNSRHFVTINL